MLASSVVPENASGRCSDKMAALPIIDFGPFLSSTSTASETNEVALEIDRACREVGFFYLKNHGVPKDITSGMLAQARHFFETATPEDKESIAIKGPSKGGDNARGWLKVVNAEKGSHEVLHPHLS